MAKDKALTRYKLRVAAALGRFNARVEEIIERDKQAKMRELKKKIGV